MDPFTAVAMPRDPTARRGPFLQRTLALISRLAGVLACAPAIASPGPSLGPPVLGLDWGQAAVEGPKNFEETLPPSFHQDHPILRFPGQAIMSDVLGLASGS